MPLIPGINDTSENIRETARFLEGLGERARRIELMPYHRLGESKYASLGRRYRLHGLLPIEPAEVERAGSSSRGTGSNVRYQRKAGIRRASWINRPSRPLR